MLLSLLATMAISFVGLVWTDDGNPQNFRKTCANPSVDGTTLTAQCQEDCREVCHNFYVSTMPLGYCVGYNPGGVLYPQENGNFNTSCHNCWNTWNHPDIMTCNCTNDDGTMTQPSMDLNTAVGSHCGRLACWHYIHDLGPPLGKPDETYCEIQSDIPSGQKRAIQPTAAPDLLYVHRGVVHRQLFPSASNTETSTTLSAFNSSTLPAPITLATPWFTPEPPLAPTSTVIRSMKSHI